ncbi:hypothetical protein CPB84DRAFT_1758696 [Gymnopilus junonius]|uniref:Uncharacterized protein n=1 Tax=Gymnopilus junonius TaxID=109634 RepID=A0A9P5TU20_GYMJU|nr:hypothetical protein CPB84DRAFT_1758696 [Gymnopilus junonius]
MQSMSSDTTVPTKPFSRIAKTPRPSSKPQSKVANRQPTASELKALGIRVRDFAYESKLPPLPTIYRHPQQIQPGIARPLERTVTETDGSQSQSQSQTNRKLERTATEPVTEPATPTFVAGFPGIEDLNSVSSLGQPLDNGFSGPLATIPIESQLRDIIDSAKAPTTPLLSSTSTNMPSQAKTGRIHPLSVEPDIDFACSRAGESSSTQINAVESSSTSQVASSSTTANQRVLRSQARRLRASGTTTTHDRDPRLNTSRYQLRKRPSPPTPVSPPDPSKRPRKSPSSQLSSKLPRRQPVSVQSSHSPVKNKDNSGPSNSRTLRKPTTASNSGKTKRKRI